MTRVATLSKKLAALSRFGGDSVVFGRCKAHRRGHDNSSITTVDPWGLRCICAKKLPGSSRHKCGRGPTEEHLQQNYRVTFLLFTAIRNYGFDWIKHLSTVLHVNLIKVK